MDIGVMVPYLTPTDGPTMLAWCRAIDDGPFASISIGERITFHNLEQRVVLSAAAAVTRRARLLTHILIAPLHPPGMLAKELASIDVISGGRVGVALGTGAREEDYRAAGTTMQQVFQRQDETALALRRLWAGEPLFPGDDPIGPRPVQPGGPPLYTSARGPRSVARAVKWATGFCGAALPGTHAAIKAEYESFMSLWRAAGGAPRLFTSTSTFFALGPGAEQRLRAVEDGYFNYTQGGAPLPAEAMASIRSQVFNDDAVRRAIDAAASVGYDQIIFIATTDDLADLDRLASVVAAM
ncbi:MAG: LLM class flavin-dependent oxidoreductase [Gammaproteobacteria bacterium]